MGPIPCQHCGFNFMRANQDAPKLCNNCLLRDQRRNNSKKDETKGGTIDIIIKCSPREHAEVEEYCVREGIDFSRYFLEAHFSFQEALRVVEEYKQSNPPPVSKKETVEIKTDVMEHKPKPINKKVKSKK